MEENTLIFQKLESVRIVSFPHYLGYHPLGCFSGGKQLGEDISDLVTSNPKYCWGEQQRPKGLGVEAQTCGYFIFPERQLGHCYVQKLESQSFLKRIAMAFEVVNPGGGDLLLLWLA